MRCNLQQNAPGVYRCGLTVLGQAVQIHPRRMRRAFGFFSSMILLAPAGTSNGGDGGGGGAGGSGDGSGNSSDGGQSAVLTESQLNQVNEAINKALGPRFRTFEEKLAKNTEASNAKLLDTFGERFGSLLEEKMASLKPTGDDGKDKKKPDATDLAQHPEFRAQAKQLADMKAELQKEREEKAKTKAAARTATLNQKVDEELAALGIVDASSLRKLLATDNIVSYEDDDSDTVVFKDEEGGALPLKKGLESWVKSSPLAKRFLPATGADGSGELREQSGTRKTGSTGDTPKMGKSALGQLIVRAAQGG